MKTLYVLLLLSVGAFSQQHSTSVPVNGTFVLSADANGRIAITCKSWRPKAKGCVIEDKKTLDDLAAALLTWTRQQSATARQKTAVKK